MAHGKISLLMTIYLFIPELVGYVLGLLRLRKEQEGESFGSVYLKKLGLRFVAIMIVLLWEQLIWASFISVEYLL